MEPTHRPLVFATVLELDIVGLLGTGHGVDARGALEVAKEELEPFEVSFLCRRWICLPHDPIGPVLVPVDR